MNRILIAVFLISTAGCTQWKQITGTENADSEADRGPQLFLVACCKVDATNYPATVPQSHVNLCTEAALAGHENRLIGGNVYLPIRNECGRGYEYIGDQYYIGQGF